MASEDQFPIYDRVVDGHLKEILSRLRYDEGLSFEKVAARLRDEHKIDKSLVTIRRWITTHVPEPVK